MKKVAEINELVKLLNENAEKFYVKGNKAAGTRVRKVAQELKTSMQELRVEVQGIKNEI